MWMGDGTWHFGGTPSLLFAMNLSIFPLKHRERERERERGRDIDAHWPFSWASSKGGPLKKRSCHSFIEVFHNSTIRPHQLTPSHIYLSAERKWEARGLVFLFPRILWKSSPFQVITALRLQGVQPHLFLFA